MLNDQMRQVVSGLRAHAHSFKGLDSEVEKVLRDFKAIEVRDFYKEDLIYLGSQAGTCS